MFFNTSRSSRTPSISSQSAKTRSLLWAIQEKDLDALKKAIHSIQDINRYIPIEVHSLKTRGSALHAAVYQNWPEGIKLLIAKGANLNLKTKAGDTALHIAIEYNLEKLVHCLLNHPDTKIKINLLHGTQKKSPLQWAIFYKRKAIAVFLLKKGADYSKLEINELNSLPYITVEYNLRELAGNLLKLGADFIAFSDQDQKTIIEKAIDKEHWDIVECFLKQATKQTIDSGIRESYRKRLEEYASKNNNIIKEMLDDEAQAKEIPSKQWEIVKLCNPVRQSSPQAVQALVQKDLNANVSQEAAKQQQLVYCIVEKRFRTAQSWIEQGVNDLNQLNLTTEAIENLISNALDGYSVYLKSSLPLSFIKHLFTISSKLNTHQYLYSIWKKYLQATRAKVKIAYDILEFFQSLLPKDKKFQIHNEEGKSILITEIYGDHLENVKWLLEQGLDPNDGGPLGIIISRLFYEIPNKDQKKARLILSLESLIPCLLQYGANPNFPKEPLPLLYKLINGYYKRDPERVLKITEWLLQNKADPNFDNFPYDSFLYSALKEGQFDMAKLLLQYGANPNECVSIVEGRGKLPYLHRVIEDLRYKKIEALKCLLAGGADPNSVDCDGNTPLHRVVKKSWRKEATPSSIITLLLEYGADMHVKDSEGHTPLTYHCHQRLGRFR